MPPTTLNSEEPDFPSGARYMLPEHILSGNLQVNP